MLLRVIFTSVFFLFLALSPLFAFSESVQDQSKQSGETLHPFSTVTIRDIWTLSRWNAPDTANVVEVRSLVSFKFWDQMQLMRIVVPYRTKFGSTPGVGDVRLFDLVAFKKNWGLWGVGPAVNMRAKSALVSDTFQVGPAFGFVISKRRWGFGLLNQNLFSNQIAATTLQPILSYQLTQSFLIGLGELPFVYDWRRSSFLFAPLGFQLSYVSPTPEQVFRVFINPQVNTRNIRGISLWTLTTGISFLIRPTESSVEGSRP